MRGISYDSKIKDLAFKMRRRGKTFNEITNKLGIPKTTLSYWFIGIELSSEQKALIKKNWLKAIVGSRTNAIKWHNEQKQSRILLAKNEAQDMLSRVNLDDDNYLELALAFLYLGEGSKKNWSTSLGNSDPIIIRFFLNAMRRLYNVDTNKLRIVLHLRADQDIEAMKLYWSKVLGVPTSLIKAAYLDKRTIGRPTYDDYKGVCVIDCGQVAIQRRLVWISQLFCEKIITMRA